MARLALTLGATAAGAVIGAQFGASMLGAQLGMIAGSIASALLFPGGEDQKGPRLGDTRISDASYGVPIPIVYGAARVAGTMIWTSGLEERSNEESLKGGGPTSTTYTYYSSFASGLCEGPIESVRKIWLDTKLVYDVSSTNLGIIQQRIGDLDPRNLLSEDELDDRRDEIQAELTKVQSALTIYLGTATQLPDPVMEAHEGVGEVPAHRGLAYLLFADLPLEAYGNRIPNVTAEVMTQSAPAYPKVTVIPTTDMTVDQMLLDNARQILWSLSGQTIHQVDAINNTLVRSETVDTTLIGGGPIDGQAYALGFAVDQDGALYVALSLGAFARRLVRLDPVSLEVTHLSVNNITGAPDLQLPEAYIWTSPTYVWYTGWTGPSIAYCFARPGAINPRTGLPVTTMIRTGDYQFDGPIANLIGKCGCVDRDETAWIICSVNSTAFSLETWLVHMNPIGTAVYYNLSASLAGGKLIAYDAQTHSLIIGGYVGDTAVTRVVRWDIAQQTVVASSDQTIAVNYAQSAWRQGIVGRRLYMGYIVDRFIALDVDTLTIVYDQSLDFTTWGPATFAGAVYDPATQAMWVTQSGAGFVKYYLDRLDVGGVTLATIVNDLSRRAGLAASDLDTAALTDPVHGFVVSQRAEARASVEALLGAFMADGVESDWRLVFQHRNRLPDATLTGDDLAAHEPGTTLPDVLTPERLDDQQLPIRLDITYADPARDYQDTVQHARRMQAGQRARSQREMRIPVILSADQARQLAEQSLHETWVSRTQYRLSLPYRWSLLDPGDVLEVQAGSQQALIRVQQIQHGANGILEVQAVAYDRHIYTASVSVGAVADAITTQTMTMTAPTALFLLDTHLLRDIDEGAGYYMAMAPQGGGSWSGATAFSSPDGASWRMEVMLTTPGSYGSALTILGPGTPYVFDHGHTVDVRLARGTLASVSEAELINGANAALLGDEIVQWQTATPLDDTSWRLSRLLRGRRGTEWATSTHRSGERFIVLTTALHRAQMGLSEVDSTRLYRAVSMNTDAATSTAQAFKNTALGLKPYSPDHLAGSRNATNDLTITWVRRTRLGGLWVDNRDVPLGETSEAYEVDITSGGTVVRTFTSTTPTVTYLASQQSSDGLTPGAPVTVTAYQMGTLGRGWGATATL